MMSPENHNHQSHPRCFFFLHILWSAIFNCRYIRTPMSLIQVAYLSTQWKSPHWQFLKTSLSVTQILRVN